MDCLCFSHCLFCLVPGVLSLSHSARMPAVDLDLYDDTAVCYYTHTPGYGCCSSDDNGAYADDPDTFGYHSDPRNDTDLLNLPVWYGAARAVAAVYGEMAVGELWGKGLCFGQMYH